MHAGRQAAAKLRERAEYARRRRMCVGWRRRREPLTHESIYAVCNSCEAGAEKAILTQVSVRILRVSKDLIEVFIQNGYKKKTTESN